MTQDVEMKEQPQVPATAAAVSNSVSSPTPVLQRKCQSIRSVYLVM